MSGCHCSRYQAPLETRADVEERSRHTEAIRSALEPLAGTAESWMRLYRCTRCGQFWQSSWPSGERYGAGEETLYPVLPVDPAEWAQRPFPDQVAQAEHRSELQSFLDSLGEEIGPEACRAAGCAHLRVAQSAFCGQHHLEQLQQVGIKPTAAQDRSQSRRTVWTREGRNILLPENMEKIRAALERTAVIVEHWFYYGGRAPDRLVFDDFEEFTGYLEAKARLGDAFRIWDFGAVCRDDDTLVNAKYPNEAGLVPARGSY